jgi:hypothetical protein
MKHKLRVLAVVLAAGLIAAAAAVAASSPSVTTGSATSIKQTSAVLNGTVNPNGSATSYAFQWGLTNSYGAGSNPHAVGSGTGTVAAHATATGLIPGTTYHYRLAALNRFGLTVGRDRTFKTTGHPPPGVSTGPAAQVGKTSATVTGVVNPHGQSTSWTFQWGTTVSYGYNVFGGTVPGNSAPVTVTWPLSGLAPGTVFHYRIVASHGGAFTSYGDDGSFMTFPAQRQVSHVRAGTRPHRARRRPFLFTTSGRLSHPSWMPNRFVCSGAVTIRFFLGKRRVAFSLVPIQPNCTFSGLTTFNRRPGRGRGRRHLRVVVRYLGTGYLKPASARSETVVLG